VSVAQASKKASPLQVAKAVFWSFLGIRKRTEHEKIEVTPLQVIIIGVIAGAIFVGTIVSVVQWVTR